MKHKREKGAYYTVGDPFTLRPFRKWAAAVQLRERVILEPFAGSNNIITMLRNNDYADEFVSYDIEPANRNVKRADTIRKFPVGFDAIVTNPPWLAKNSAKRRGLKFPDTAYDDLYKHCLDLCLQNCRYVAALIPATFLQCGLLQERLDTFIILHNRDLFTDTDNPAALALFGVGKKRTKIYHDNQYIGILDELREHLPKRTRGVNVRFNDPEGNLGFIAFDNTREPTIRFCKGHELNGYTVGGSARMITRIQTPFGGKEIHGIIAALNNDIHTFREETEDVFLTPFKGLRSDGRYRRRMDYTLARNFITQYA